MLNNNKPFFTVEEAGRIALALYGLHTEVCALPGERDCNFHLMTGAGEGFVLKIAPAVEQRDAIDLQNKALEHLVTRTPLLLVPRVRVTAGGETIATVTSAEGTKHLVRVFAFVPGKVLAETKPHTPELLHSLGSMMGKIDHALQDFTHSAAHRTLKWDLQHTLWIRDYLQYIEQPERRAIVERFLSQFEEQVLPVASSLRRSVIHNDANDYNVLVNTPDGGFRRVASVVDFGDMVYTYTICELAIAAAYAMSNKADPIAAAWHVVAGYHEAFSLSESEIEVLYALICARLCISVVNSAYQQKVEPQNDYLMISEQPAWALLEQLVDVHPRLAHYTFRHACRLPPCSSSNALVAWLESNADKMGGVVEPDLRVAKKVIFDLSMGSRELGHLVELSDVEVFTRHLFARMRAANSSVGIGRYNETRPIYTSDQYKLEGNDGPEWRTVHIGLDVFMEAGASILAPLDGVVHSFRNNDAPLDYGPTIILQHSVDYRDKQLTFYTLYGHLSEDSLDGLYEGKHIVQGTPFCNIGNYPVNGGWPPHLHFQIITDLLDRTGEFPGVARPSQREVWLSLSPDPNLIVGIPRESFPVDGLSVEEIRRERAEHIGKSLSISYQKPLKIVRGSMQYLYDEDGRAYLDAVNNVSHVGHCHSRVVKAGQEQMTVLNTNTRYLHDNLVRYAERLCATLPESLSVCFFVCSGSEANELALRLARTHTRQKDLIVVDAAYHGNTTSLIKISPYKFDGPGGMGAPSYVHKVPMPDAYRGKYKRNDPHAGEKYARYVEKAILEIQEKQGNVTGFICESLLGCGGQIVLPENYLKEAYRYVRNAGGVCIADEVQVGFGRVGTHFWGFETQGVVPDIVTLGKPIGNGHPLAAVVTTPEIAASFDNGMEYFNTFGGNPVSCAIGLAVLDVIAEERLQENALRVGTHLMDGLRGLMEKHTLIGDVRGLGLFVGIELVLDRETLAPAAAQASYIANRMRERGILLSTDGPLHNVLKIKPPLVFTEENADFLVGVLDEILEEDFVRG
ncbi:MAG TPA: aminotransferase class III-fold pyridoxal phosphate-dependent enzyme [Ktedonobacteraceae bacterium]